MDLNHVEQINCDDENKVLFLGFTETSMLSKLMESLEKFSNPLRNPIFVVDPKGGVNSFKLSEQCLVFVSSIFDLPEEMGDFALVINDGCGYLSFILHEDRFISAPKRIFCTVQMARPTTL